MDNAKEFSPIQTSVYLVQAEEDMTEGRGGMRVLWTLGAFKTAQDAWDAINDKGGIMGRHPRNFNFAPWEGVDNWQQYKARHLHAADYDVKEVPINE